MKEYIGRKGNTLFLISKDTNEAYSFTEFGEAISGCDAKSAMLELNGIYEEVDILSILGEISISNRRCEIYLKGYTAIVKDYYINVYHKLYKQVSIKNHMVYTIKPQPSVKNILVPVVKGTINREQINKILGCSLDWVKIV